MAYAKIYRKWLGGDYIRTCLKYFARATVLLIFKIFEWVSKTVHKVDNDDTETDATAQNTSFPSKRIFEVLLIPTNNLWSKYNR